MHERVPEYRLSNESFFTPRQLDVLKLSLQGLSRKQIAEELSISVHSVSNAVSGHISNPEEVFYAAPSQAGILGIVERVCGERPANLKQAKQMLMEKSIIEISD